MDKFNYCVGRKYGQGFSSFSVNNRKWGKANTSTIPFTAQLNEIQYGTMEDAEKFKQYCERQTGRKYEIYKIEKLKKEKIKSNGNQ